MFAFTSTNIDLSGAQMHNIQNADYMFAFTGLAPYTRIFNIVNKRGNKAMGYFTYLNLPKVTNEDQLPFTFAQGSTTNYMFLMTLLGEPGTFDTEEHMTLTPQEESLDFLDTSNVVSMKGMFMLSSANYDLQKLNTTNVKSTMLMFAGYGLFGAVFAAAQDKIDLNYFPEIKFPATKTNTKFKLIGDCDTRYMFSFFIEFPGISDKKYGNFDLQGIDVGELTNFKSMFAFGLGIFNFDLSK